MRPLYEWPRALPPSAAIIIAPSNTIDGAVSRNGYENNIPMPGSRNQMRLEFPYRAAYDGHWFSWAVNQGKSALWRIPVFNTPQLATSAAIKIEEKSFKNGIPFSTKQSFSTGFGFKYQPIVDLVDDVLEGDTTVKIDVSRYPGILTYGNVFGLGRSVYHVDDIDYDGDIATVECRTPFRRDIAASGTDRIVSLRPSLICQMGEINSFIALFEPAGIVRPGAITLNEVIDERFL